VSPKQLTNRRARRSAPCATNRRARRPAPWATNRRARRPAPWWTNAAATALLLAAGFVFGLSNAERVSAQVPAAAPAAAPMQAAAKSSQRAYDAQAASSDPATPGLVQPIPFNHAIHATDFKIGCLYCHSDTDKARMAGVPSVEVCMGCHAQFGGDLGGVQALTKLWTDKQPVAWDQIYRLPEYVKFRHNRHVAFGVTCQRCHGPVETMDKVQLTKDTIWWPWLLPSTKPQMGWCIDCHRLNQVSQDCLTCHY